MAAKEKRSQSPARSHLQSASSSNPSDVRQKRCAPYNHTSDALSTTPPSHTNRDQTLPVLADYDPRYERSAYRLFPSSAIPTAQRPTPPTTTRIEAVSTIARSRRSLSVNESEQSLSRDKMLPYPRLVTKPASNDNAARSAGEAPSVGALPDIAANGVHDRAHRRSFSAPWTASQQKQLASDTTSTADTEPVSRVQQVQRLLAQQRTALEKAQSSASDGADQRQAVTSTTGIQQSERLQPTGLITSASQSGPQTQRIMGPNRPNPPRTASPARRLESPVSASSSREPVGLGLTFGSNATTPDLNSFPVPGHSPNSHNSRPHPPYGYPVPRPHSPHGHPMSRPHSPHGLPMPRPHSPHGGSMLRPSSPQRQYGISSGSPHHYAPQYGRPQQGSRPHSPRTIGRADSPIYTPPGLSAKRMLDHNLRVDTEISSPQRLPQASAQRQQQTQQHDIHRDVQSRLPTANNTTQSLQPPEQEKKTIRKSTWEKPLPAPPPIEELIPPAPPADFSDASQDESVHDSPISSSSPLSEISPVSPLYPLAFLHNASSYPGAAPANAPAGSPVSAMTTLDLDVPPQIPLDAPSVPPIPKSITRKPVAKATPTPTEPTTPLTPPSSKFQIKVRSPIRPPVSPQSSISRSTMSSQVQSSISPGAQLAASPEESRESRQSVRSPVSSSTSPQPSESPVRVEKARSIAIQPLERAMIEPGTRSHRKAPSVALAPSLITLSEQPQSAQAVSKRLQDRGPTDNLALDMTGLPSAPPAPEHTSAKSAGGHSMATSITSVPSLYTLTERPQEENDVKNAVSKGTPRPDLDAMGRTLPLLAAQQPKLAEIENELRQEDAEQESRSRAASRVDNGHISSQSSRPAQSPRTTQPRRPTIESKASPVSPRRPDLVSGSQSASQGRHMFDNAVRSAQQETSMLNNITQSTHSGELALKSFTQSNNLASDAISSRRHDSKPAIEHNADVATDGRPSPRDQIDEALPKASSIKNEDHTERAVQDMAFPAPPVSRSPSLKQSPQEDKSTTLQVATQARALPRVSMQLKTENMPSYKSFFMQQEDSPTEPMIMDFSTHAQASAQQPPIPASLVERSELESSHIAKTTPASVISAKAAPGSVDESQAHRAQAILVQPLPAASSPPTRHVEAQLSEQKQQASTVQNMTPSRPAQEQAPVEAVGNPARQAIMQYQQEQEDRLKHQAELDTSTRRTGDTASTTSPSVNQTPRQESQQMSGHTAQPEPQFTRPMRRFSPGLSAHPVKAIDELSSKFVTASNSLEQTQSTPTAEEMRAQSQTTLTSQQPAAQETPRTADTRLIENASKSATPAKYSPSTSPGAQSMVTSAQNSPAMNEETSTTVHSKRSPRNQEDGLHSQGPNYSTSPPVRPILPVIGNKVEHMSVPRTARTPRIRPNSAMPPPVPRKDTVKAVTKKAVPPAVNRVQSQSSVHSSNESEPSSNAELARHLSERSNESPSIDAIRARVAGISQRTAKAVEAPAKDKDSLLAALEDLSEQSEALHHRYAGMRVERQKLSSSITTKLRENKAGPEYTTTLLDQHMALSAVTSSMDICFAKLKSLDCRKEEAIAALLTQIQRKSPSTAPRTKNTTNSKPQAVASPRKDIGQSSTALKEQSRGGTREQSETSRQAPQKSQSEIVHTTDDSPVNTHVKQTKPATVSGSTHKNGEFIDRDTALATNNSIDSGSRLVVTLGPMKNAKTPPPQRPLPAAPPTKRKSPVDSIHASMALRASTPEDRDLWTPQEDQPISNALKKAGKKDVRVFADDDFLDYYSNAS